MPSSRPGSCGPALLGFVGVGVTLVDVRMVDHFLKVIKRNLIQDTYNNSFKITDSVNKQSADMEDLGTKLDSFDVKEFIDKLAEHAQSRPHVAANPLDQKHNDDTRSANALSKARSRLQDQVHGCLDRGADLDILARGIGNPWRTIQSWARVLVLSSLAHQRWDSLPRFDDLDGLVLGLVGLSAWLGAVYVRGHFGGKKKRREGSKKGERVEEVKAWITCKLNEVKVKESERKKYHHFSKNYCLFSPRS